MAEQVQITEQQAGPVAEESRQSDRDKPSFARGPHGAPRP